MISVRSITNSLEDPSVTIWASTRGVEGQFREMPHLSGESFGDYHSLSLTRSSEGGHLRRADLRVWESFSYYVTDAPPNVKRFSYRSSRIEIGMDSSEPKSAFDIFQTEHWFV